VTSERDVKEDVNDERAARARCLGVAFIAIASCPDSSASRNTIGAISRGSYRL